MPGFTLVLVTGCRFHPSSRRCDDPAACLAQLECFLSLIETRKVRICIGCSVTCAPAFGSVTAPPVSVVSLICCASPNHDASQPGKSTVACLGKHTSHHQSSNRPSKWRAQYRYSTCGMLFRTCCESPPGSSSLETRCCRRTSSASSSVPDDEVGESQMRGGNGLHRRSELQFDAVHSIFRTL